MVARHQARVAVGDEGDGAIPVPLEFRRAIGVVERLPEINASIGVMDAGIGRFSAPFKPFTAELAEFAEGPLVTDFAGRAKVSAVSLVPLVPLGFPSSSFVPLVVEVFAFDFFLSTRARVSASQAAFAPPRDAFLLLCHSAEPASPAICDMVRLVSTDLSYLSISNRGTTCSSCFLISSHSLPLLPGRRA